MGRNVRAPASFDLRHLWARGDGVGADAVSTRPRDAGVIGEPNQIPQKYVLRGYKREDVQTVSSQTLEDASTDLEEDGTVVYAFTKLLDEPGEKSVTSPFVWAHGSGSLGYHGSKAGALELNLETCEASSIKTETVSASLIKIHGGLFLVAFSVCMPAALVAARGRSYCGGVCFFLLCRVDGVEAVWSPPHAIAAIVTAAGGSAPCGSSCTCTYFYYVSYWR